MEISQPTSKSVPTGTSINTEELITVSSLVAQLVRDSQTGAQAALIQQIETANQECELVRQLPDDVFASRMVPIEEVIEELRQLFPPPHGIDLPTGVTAGAPYVRGSPDKEIAEDPPIKELIGYEIKAEDVRKSVITRHGERAIILHSWHSIGTRRRRALQELYKRGMPYLVVDHGRMNVKLSFCLQQQKPTLSKLKEWNLQLSRVLGLAAKSPVYPTLPTLRACMVNERNIEALGRNSGAIGELEINFKVDLR